MHIWLPNTYTHTHTYGDTSGKELSYQCWGWGFIPWVRKIPCRRAWQSTPVFLPGESHGQRSLVGYNPKSCRKLDTTEVTLHAHSICITIHVDISSIYIYMCVCVYKYIFIYTQQFWPSQNFILKEKHFIIETIQNIIIRDRS